MTGWSIWKFQEYLERDRVSPRWLVENTRLQDTRGIDAAVWDWNIAKDQGWADAVGFVVSLRGRRP